MTRRLLSLASLVILAFAIMIVSVAAQSPTLAPELLSKMLDHIAREGDDRVVNAFLANRLGLSAAGQSWPIRQIARQEASGTLHNVSVGRVSDKNIVLNLNTKENVSIYRIRRDGTLLVALTYDILAQQLTDLDRAEAQKGLEAELIYWREHLK